MANFGVLAVEFDDESDYDDIDQDDVLHVENLRDTLESKDEINVHNVTKDKTFTVRHRLSARQIADVLAGGLIPRLASEKYSDHQEAEETTVRTGGDKG